MSNTTIKSKRLLIGISGSIAAYKAADLVSQLVQQGGEVRVAMTESATRFIAPLTLATLSRHPVHVSQFSSDTTAAAAGSPSPVEHIELARWAELVCVAPASADFICKYAYGIADNLLLTELLAFEGPVLLAPAMNHSMWRSFQVRQALDRLLTHGVALIDPASGALACGEEGIGRMAAIAEIMAAIEATVAAPTAKSESVPLLQGQRLLITAGPTRAHIDPVRFISNRSSGKMGYALAEAATALGAEVTLISGPVSESLTFPNTVAVTTATEMYRAVMQHLPECDAFISAAAVNDYAPLASAPQKLKRGAPSIQLELKPEPDILTAVATSPARPPLIVGFAAETANHLEHGRRKLIAKALDFIVVNDVGGAEGAFGADISSATLIAKNGKEYTFGRLPKRQLSNRLLETIYADYWRPQPAENLETRP